MPRSPHLSSDPAFQLYLGVDGGGTRTSVALMNHKQEIVGQAVGGPSNPLRVGVETAVANIANALDRACDAANVSRGDIVAATLGLAGVRRRDIRARVRDSFMARFRLKTLTVVTDADIALFGTTLGEAGLVIIAGTGSACMGVNTSGRRAMAGGWGPIAGDEGGGRGIAGDALHRIAKASDGRGPATKLSERAAEYFRASSAENLIGAIYSPQMDNSRIAGFAELVVKTALEGDNIAVAIINDAAHELAEAAIAVIRELGLEKTEFPIGCVGSVFKAGRILTDPIKRIISAVAPGAALAEAQMPPAQAAALMALNDFAALN